MLTTMGIRELNEYFKGPLFYGEVLDVHSSFATILPRKWELGPISSIKLYDKS